MNVFFSQVVELELSVQDAKRPADFLLIHGRRADLHLLDELLKDRSIADLFGSEEAETFSSCLVFRLI